MRKLLARVANIILRPEREWPAIVRERAGWRTLVPGYLVPLALIGPLAHGAQLFFGDGGVAHEFPAAGVVLTAVTAGFLMSLLSVLVMGLAISLVVPLYKGQRDFAAAIEVVTYAGTPVWLAGMILIMPLDRYPLLVVVILIAIMHGLFLFYLGLHHVIKVARGDAAECTAIIVAAGTLFSSVIGYYASAAGLFPQL